MGFASELAERRKRENAEALAKAMREAEATGKEPFDLARFEQLLTQGSQARSYQEHLQTYYISHPEIRSLVEYVQHLRDMEPWVDRFTHASLARTVKEMRFAAGLEPCSGCGLCETGALELDGEGRRWTCRGQCPRCGIARSFEFSSELLSASAIELDEIGWGASKLIRPEQFLRAMQENACGIPDDPMGLTPRQRSRLLTRLTRAQIAASELLKLLPDSTQLQLPNPALHRANVEEENKQLFKLTARYGPPNTIPFETLEARSAHMTTLIDVLHGLLSLVQPNHMPDAQEVRAHFEARALDVSEAGPYLVTPVWAYGVSGAEDIFVELEPEGDVPGIRVWKERLSASAGGPAYRHADSRDWSANAEITVRRGLLRDVEAVVSPMQEAAHHGPLFATVFATPTVAGHRLQVTIQHQNEAVRIVSVSFDDL